MDKTFQFKVWPVLLEACGELDRATSKFPTWPTDPLHAVGVVAEEMGELQREVLQLTYEPTKSTKESVRKEAIQLAAMSLRFLMSLDQYEYSPGPQHQQIMNPTGHIVFDDVEGAR
ncbi:MAG: hypothetical protein J0M24_13935 [Verrucomicrobia bacterium]|nr:hypothetical protein [Verrucomicrobiota bacterium]